MSQPTLNMPRAVKPHPTYILKYSICCEMWFSSPWVGIAVDHSPKKYWILAARHYQGTGAHTKCDAPVQTQSGLAQPK